MLNRLNAYTCLDFRLASAHLGLVPLNGANGSRVTFIFHKLQDADVP
jgi:hypothetical protein